MNVIEQIISIAIAIHVAIEERVGVLAAERGISPVKGKVIKVWSPYEDLDHYVQVTSFHKLGKDPRWDLETPHPRWEEDTQYTKSPLGVWAARERGLGKYDASSGLSFKSLEEMLCFLQGIEKCKEELAEVLLQEGLEEKRFIKK